MKSLARTRTKTQPKLGNNSDRIHKVVMSHFPWAEHNEYAGDKWWRAQVGDRSISVEEHRPSEGVEISFYNSKESNRAPMEVTKETRPGSMNLWRKLGDLASSLRDENLPITYTGDQHHRRVYERVLKRAGYVHTYRENVPNDKSAQVREVWHPTTEEGQHPLDEAAKMTSQNIRQHLASEQVAPHKTDEFLKEHHFRHMGHARQALKKTGHPDTTYNQQYVLNRARGMLGHPQQQEQKGLLRHQTKSLHGGRTLVVPVLLKRRSRDDSAADPDRGNRSWGRWTNPSHIRNEAGSGQQRRFTPKTRVKSTGSNEPQRSIHDVHKLASQQFFGGRDHEGVMESRIFPGYESVTWNKNRSEESVPTEILLDFYKEHGHDPQYITPAHSTYHPQVYFPLGYHAQQEGQKAINLRPGSRVIVNGQTPAKGRVEEVLQDRPPAVRKKNGTPKTVVVNTGGRRVVSEEHKLRRQRRKGLTETKSIPVLTPGDPESHQVYADYLEENRQDDLARRHRDYANTYQNTFNNLSNAVNIIHQDSYPYASTRVESPQRGHTFHVGGGLHNIQIYHVMPGEHDFHQVNLDRMDLRRDKNNSYLHETLHNYLRHPNSPLHALRPPEQQGGQ